MLPGWTHWKAKLLLRERQAEAAAAQAAADAAAATADSSTQQAEALAAAAGAVNAPTYYFAGNPLIIGFVCTTSGATIRYRINGGAWNAYSSPVTLTIGDYIEAQGQKGGLTDSGITRYDT